MPPVDAIAATRRLTPFTRLAGGALMLAGLSVLAGWAFDIAVLKSLVAGTVTMKANTALAFVLAGSALWLQARDPWRVPEAGTASAPPPRILGPRLVAQGCAAIVVAIGLLTLAQYLLGWNLGIDQLLFHDTAHLAGTTHPGRMAPDTALGFGLGGGALLLLGARFGPRTGGAAKIAAGLVATIGLLGLLGYLSGVTLGYRWWTYTSMAISTAALFLVFSAGLMALAWRAAPVRWEIDRRTAAAFSAALLLLVLLLSLVLRLVGHMESTVGKVADSNEVRFHLGELYAGVVDLETGERGFLLSGDESFLAPYYRALREIPVELSTLRDWFADNPAQRRRLQSLEPFIAAKVEFAAATIRARRQQGYAAAEALIKTGRGNAQMEEIRRQLDGMNEAEDLATADRRAEAEKASDVASLMLPVGGLFSMALLFYGILRLNRETAARRSAEQHLRLQSGALDMAANAIMITSRTGAIESVNQAFTALSGYTPAEVLGKNPRELIRSGRHDTAFYGAMWATILSGRVWHGEMVNRRKDGSVYPEEMTITPLRDEGGEITHFIAIKQDITARRQAAEKLALSEERFRSIFQAVPTSIWEEDWTEVIAMIRELKASGVTDFPAFFAAQPAWVEAALRAVRILNVNDATLKIFEAGSQTNLLSSLVTVFATHETKPGFVSELVALAAGVRIFETEMALRTAQGRLVHVMLSMSFPPPGDESGTVLVSLMDITVRKRDEAALREQSMLLDKARDAIIVRDLDRRITYWNKSAERLYGWTAAEAVGRDIGDLLYPANKSVFESATASLLIHGEWIGEIMQTGKDGRNIIVEARGTLVHDNAGRPVSVLMINSDISERKKIEGQFLRAQRVESIGELAGGIAHDLNNVLAPIIMSISLLKRTIPGDNEQRILGVIERSAQRGADMVKQVLTFARGEEGHHIPIPPKHLTDDLASVMAETFPKSITCEVNVAPGVWPILGDPTQLHQVLLNLCVNARDAMPDRGRLTISVENTVIDEHYAKLNRSARAGPHVLLKVTDTGTGIPAEIRDKIFDPFFTTKPKGKGTGLGLATVATILGNHGGFIQVDSEPGRGTTFTLGFPAETMGLVLSTPGVPSVLPLGAGELLLVVDDESSVRIITQQMLASHGYRVLLADNGAEALKLYTRHQAEIALVLTDMMMPVMDGTELSRELLRANPRVRILAVSGYNDGTSVARAVGIGVRNFLPKPCTAEAMLKTLRQILSSPA